MDYTQALYGQHARHVPAWMYVQDGGTGIVSFVGASKVNVEQHLAGVHPLRYGSTRTHQLIVGEIIVRPHLVVATDDLRGMGLAGLATNDHWATAENGERIIDINR